MGKCGAKIKVLSYCLPKRRMCSYGPTGHGNIVGNGKSARVQKYICRTCGRIFYDRSNTMLYDLRTSEEILLLLIAF